MQPLSGLFPTRDPRRLQTGIPSGDSLKPIILALAGYHVIVNHFSCVQPMRHSVLPVKGGVKS